MALRRFTSRRGTPLLMYSDNASTLKRIGSDVTKLINAKVVQNYLLAERIKWEHSLVGRPQTNGFVEAMVKLVKNALRKTLARSLLTFEEMTCVLCEIECTINSRPLILQPGDNDINYHVITPSYLMCGKTLSSLPP